MGGRAGLEKNGMDTGDKDSAAVCSERNPVQSLELNRGVCNPVKSVAER